MPQHSPSHGDFSPLELQKALVELLEKHRVNMTADLDPGTKPTEQQLSWVCLHPVLVEHLLAPAVPAVTAALWADHHQRGWGDNHAAGAE